MINAYHIDLGQRDVRIGMYDDFDFDEMGIPRYQYGGKPFYNPTFVAHFGLYQLGLYQRTGNAERLTSFLKMADWFLETGTPSTSGLRFEYSIPMPGLQVPWVSALGQGRAISVLTRAFQATGNAAYRRAAFDAFGVYTALSRDGGVRTQFPGGGVAFEEYPRSHPDIVLNGLITSLFGLFDLANSQLDHELMSPDHKTAHADNDQAAPSALFEEAVVALERNLFRYDVGYWSAYDLSRRVASDEYHAYHVTLLWALHEISGVDGFADWARRWDNYRSGPRLFFGRNLSRVKSRVAQRSVYR